MGVYFQDVSVEGVLIGPNHKVRAYLQMHLEEKL